MCAVAARDEPDVETLVASSIRLFEQGQLSEAAETLYAVLVLSPCEPRAPYGLGVIELREERWAGALARGNQTLALAPRFPCGYQLVGDALHGLGRPGQALAAYRQGFECCVSDKRAQPELAIRIVKTLAQLGELAEAAEFAQRFLISESLLALRTVEGTAEVHQLLGILWKRLALLPDPERRGRAVRRATPPRGRRPVVLVVCPQWFDARARNRVSLEHYAVAMSLEATGIAEVVPFFTDAPRAGQSLDLALLDAVSPSRVDAVVYVHPADGKHLRLDLLRTLRAVCPAPIVMMHTDSASPWNIWAQDALTPLSDLNVTMDGQGGFTAFSFCPSAYRGLWTPLDPRWFHPNCAARDIDVCFIGTVESVPERLATLALLFQEGIDVVAKVGGVGPHAVSFEEYAAHYRRAKIVLNFSRVSVDPRLHHLKGRVFEAMACGALLLETANSETARLFTPGEDYDTFTDGPELLRKVRYYLGNEPARAAIAERGHAKATTHYSAERFWRAVLGEVGVVEAAP